MAEEKDDSDKTEEPSQHRIEEFRKKGQVAASKELASVLVLSACVLTLGISILFIYEQMDEFMRWLYGLNIEKAFQAETQQLIMNKGIIVVMMCIGPVLLVSLIIGVLSHLNQIGFIFAPDVMEVKFDKINPINGFKRLFSIKSVAEAVKGILKFSMIIFIAYHLLWNKFGAFAGFLQSTPVQGLMYGKEFVLELIFFMILGLGIVAGFDFAWEKFQYQKKLRQTKQQVKEESKEKDGSPEVKQRIRSIQRDAAMKRMIQDVPKADVIVTNPTHISIALRYDPTTMIAPEVIAKGADHVAFRIREIAAEHDIPMVENIKLARALYKTVKVGHGVPKTLYKTVAEILAFVYKNKKRKFHLG